MSCRNQRLFGEKNDLKTTDIYNKSKNDFIVIITIHWLLLVQVCCHKAHTLAQANYKPAYQGQTQGLK